MAECAKCNGTGFIFTGPNEAAECSCVQERRARSIYKRSGFTMIEEVPLIQKSREYVANFGKSKRNWMFITGPTGSGKTTQAAAIAKLLILGKKGIITRFIDGTEFSLQIAANYYDQNFLATVLSLCEVPLLVLDDFMKGVTKADTNVFRAYEMIIWSRTRNIMPTIITSEKSLKEFSRLDTAMASRIYSMCGDNQFRMENKNYRIK